MLSLRKSFRKIKSRFWRVFIALAGMTFLLLAYMYMETRWLKLNNLEISSADVPDSFVGKKIVFVADIHHGPYLSQRRVRKLVERINSQEPDIILLGGDYVQRDSKYVRPFYDEIQNLRAKLGVFGVQGNHDHWEDLELSMELMQDCGIKICDNESYWVEENGSRIKIGGVGDLWEDTQEINSTIHDCNEDDFVILISHNPDYFEEMNEKKIDLAVAGHTHGGQVTFFGKSAPVLPIKYGNKYRYGLVKKEDTYLYITSGVGTVTPPVRFFCRPELVVFELNRSEDK